MEEYLAKMKAPEPIPEDVNKRRLGNVIDSKVDTMMAKRT